MTEMAATSDLGPRHRRDSMDHPLTAFRLVLVGKTGSGKSSSGNTILGGEVFEAAGSHFSVTGRCCKERGEVSDRQVTIVDTPGLFDTSFTDDTVKREISKCINMSAPGPHAILLVIKVGAFTGEEQAAVRQVEEMFGPDAWRYTIVLFTHGDLVQGDFEQQIIKKGGKLESVLKKVDHRFHVLNNLKMNERGQVLDLLEKVERMVDANGGRFYSNYTYQQVVEMLNQREEELKKFYQKKLQEEVKAVETKYEEKLRKFYQKRLEEGMKTLELKYEEKLKEAQQERDQVEKRLQRELKELRRYYQVLERGVRHVVENTVDTDSFEQVLKEFHQTQKLKLTS